MDFSIFVWPFIAYVLGSVVSFFIGRKMGISIGSTLTFDLLVRMGYVKYHIGESGEVVIEKVAPGDD